jgi:CheY-like chemotaxis protein
MPGRILSISYDHSLLETRHMMLQQEGYQVTSAEGLTAALEACRTVKDFDLIIMGHSIPPRDKRAILAALRQEGCDAPVLSLLRHGEDAIPEATRAIDPDPQHLLDTAALMLTEQQRAKRA